MRTALLCPQAHAHMEALEGAVRDLRALEAGADFQARLRIQSAALAEARGWSEGNFAYGALNVRRRDLHRVSCLPALRRQALGARLAIRGAGHCDLSRVCSLCSASRCDSRCYRSRDLHRHASTDPRPSGAGSTLLRSWLAVWQCPALAGAAEAARCGRGGRCVVWGSSLGWLCFFTSLCFGVPSTGCAGRPSRRATNAASPPARPRPIPHRASSACASARQPAGWRSSRASSPPRRRSARRAARASPPSRRGTCSSRRSRGRRSWCSRRSAGTGRSTGGAAEVALTCSPVFCQRCFVATCAMEAPEPNRFPVARASAQGRRQAERGARPGRPGHRLHACAAGVGGLRRAGLDVRGAHVVEPEAELLRVRKEARARVKRQRPRLAGCGSGADDDLLWLHCFVDDCGHARARPGVFGGDPDARHCLVNVFGLSMLSALFAAL